MTDFVSPPGDARNPDHSTCRNCGQPISWDEICYVHDSNGFADCGIKFGEAEYDNRVFVINPDILRDEKYKGKFAEPVEWDQPKEEPSA